MIAKNETTKMSNPAYGDTNIIEHWAVRICDNGEFIHQNQGTVDDQGNTNVSHGCINLSAENAEEYFNSAIQTTHQRMPPGRSAPGAAGSVGPR